MRLRFSSFLCRKQRLRKCCFGSCAFYCLFYIIKTIVGLIALFKLLSSITSNANPSLFQYLTIYESELNINENYNYYRKIKQHFNYQQQYFQSGKQYFQEYGRANASLNQTSYLVLEYSTAALATTRFCKKRTQVYLNRDCLYKNCLFSCDTSLLPKADAVIIHNNDFDASKAPRRHGYDQIWTLLLSDESQMVDKKLDRVYFNWSMSYYSTSELSYCTYGCFRGLNKKLDKNRFLKSMFKPFQNRENLAIWFNSDCSNKLRLQYVGELANYYPVAVYGQLQCSEYISRYIRLHDKDAILRGDCDEQCEVNTQLKSKFYLAFESKNCSDYITRDFWRSLDNGLIPVLLQPSKIFYEHVAPYNSFIHIDDFDYDMKRLSIYLYRVANDFNLYTKYFRWRMNYRVLLEKHDTEPVRLCELCARLNTDRSRSYYASISKWFNKKCAKRTFLSTLLDSMQ